ncbi:polysaccharide biosynthesis tyrosine autokinase [Ornithinimicrobium cryptoxanthini]|uniref:non-specific protein-tyrosine kinase n=1 Tax=Ornithinimicrobium cryptoxanthini TaxID=2934161 RepID=A0ABY4YIX3_9MICO|nr:polysaccharide biosynthesis tyrosine autokinase [Ornithinimicrobium cryptoxanthini]USQ76107.1 polysaccharide biosynthesis tyrosine autokinase [Ornithinimicrobium cryptoxanthini]
MELTDYVRIARRSWRLILAAVLTVVALAALLTALTPREYRSTAQLFVSTAGGDSVSDLAQGGSFTQRQVATYADIATTPIVLDKVVAELGLDESAGSLAGRVSAVVPPNTVLIDVAVVDDDPVEAAQVANSVAAEFAETLQELERVDASGESPVKATVVKPATAPQSPASPSPLRNLALATVLGLLLGAGLAVLRDLLDTNVRGESDIHRVTDEPVIGAIAFDKDAEDHPLVIEIDPHSHRSEAFRSLRTNLFYLSPDEPARTLLITSTVPNEGKSTTSVNLALTMAETGARVCLIEGDLRRPRMLEYMGLESAAGLTDVLVGRVDVEDVLQPHVSNLHVLGCGPIPPNPSELLGSAAMERLLERLSKDYDYVVIDAPPVLAVTDAAVLSTLADGTIVVVGVGVVKRDTLSRAIAALERVDANVLGVVLNRLPVKGPDAYAYDYQSYRPGVEIEGRGRRARSKASRRRSELAQTQE